MSPLKIMQAQIFYNYSTEDFVGKWNAVPYTIKAGEKIMLEDYLVRHFAKHLAMRELGKRDKHYPIDPSTDEFGNFLNPIFKEEVKKAYGEVTHQANTAEELKTAMLNEEKKEKRFCEFCDSKGGRHKKDCPAIKKIEVKEEEEFSDLNK